MPLFTCNNYIELITLHGFFGRIYVTGLSVNRKPYPGTNAPVALVDVAPTFTMAVFITLLRPQMFAASYSLPSVRTQL